MELLSLIFVSPGRFLLTQTAECKPESTLCVRRKIFVASPDRMQFKMIGNRFRCAVCHLASGRRLGNFKKKKKRKMRAADRLDVQTIEG